MQKESRWKKLADTVLSSVIVRAIVAGAVWLTAWLLSKAKLLAE